MRLRRPSLFYPPLFECIERVTACLGRRCVHAPGHVAGRYLWCCGRCLVPGLLCFITAACVGGKCMGFKRKRKRKKTGLPCRCCRSREGEWAPLNLMLLVFSCFLFSTWEGKAVSGNGSWLGLQISGENPFETPSGPMFLLFLNITKKSFQGHLGLVYKKGLPNAGSKHTRYPPSRAGCRIFSNADAGHLYCLRAKKTLLMNVQECSTEGPPSRSLSSPPCKQHCLDCEGKEDDDETGLPAERKAMAMSSATPATSLMMTLFIYKIVFATPSRFHRWRIPMGHPSFWQRRFFLGGFCFKFVYPFFGVLNCLHMLFLLM